MIKKKIIPTEEISSAEQDEKDLAKFNIPVPEPAKKHKNKFLFKFFILSFSLLLRFPNWS
jgi:hypothetical protein